MKVVFSSLVPLVLLLRGTDARPVKANHSPPNTRLRGAGIIPTTVTRQLNNEKTLRQLKSEKSGKSKKKSKSGKSDELSKKEKSGSKSGKSGKSATGSADEARNNNADEFGVVMVWVDGNETIVELEDDALDNDYYVGFDDDALEISLLEEDAEYADDDDDATEPTDPPTSVGTSDATSEESSGVTSEETSDETEEASEESTSEESSEGTSEATSNDEPTRKSYID